MSQEFNNNVLDLVKQKGFHPYEYIGDFERFKGCACYIFAILFFKSKGEHLGHKDKCFLFHFKSSFCSRENQNLEF